MMDTITPQHLRAPYRYYLENVVQIKFNDAVCFCYGDNVFRLQRCENFVVDSFFNAFRNIDQEIVKEGHLTLQAGQHSTLKYSRRARFSNGGDLIENQTGYRAIIHGWLFDFSEDIFVDELHTLILLYDHTFSELQKRPQDKKLAKLKTMLESELKAIRGGKQKGMSEFFKKQASAKIIKNLQLDCKALSLKSLLLSHNLLSKTKQYNFSSSAFLKKAPKLIEEYKTHLEEMKNYDPSHLFGKDNTKKQQTTPEIDI